MLMMAHIRVLPGGHSQLHIPKYQTQTDVLQYTKNKQIYNADAGIHIRVLPGGHLLQMAAARPDYHTTLTWPGSQCCDSDDDDDDAMMTMMIMIMFIEPGVDHTASHFKLF